MDYKEDKKVIEQYLEDGVITNELDGALLFVIDKCVPWSDLERLQFTSFKEQRLSLGISQVALCKLLGVPRSTVWRWDNGAEPGAKFVPMLRKLGLIRGGGGL